jgi:hypothetical protein
VVCVFYVCVFKREREQGIDVIFQGQNVGGQFPYKVWRFSMVTALRHDE